MTLMMPVVELERRLSTERALDIFTMQPMVGIVTYLNAKHLTKHGTLTHYFSQHFPLQMSLPGLPFTRMIRFSVGVVIRFPIRATGRKSIHPGTHFLANGLVPRMRTDLRYGRVDCGPDDPDMYLSYPPLAEQHLRHGDVANPRVVSV